MIHAPAVQMLFKALTILSFASNSFAREMAPDVASAPRYRSGEMMANIMQDKKATFSLQSAVGAYASEQYPSIDEKVECIDGHAIAIPGNANYTFRCNNIDVYNFKSHQDLGSSISFGSSSWGWTSSDGREFVAIGQEDGTAFAEITKAGKIEYLGRLPYYSVPSWWREIRGFHDYMIIGSEAQGHGIQIFDMRRLLNLSAKNPYTFSNQEDLTAHFADLPIGKTHNVLVNEATNYIYSAGALPRNSTCRSGLIFIDMADPSKPTKTGCASAEGYKHDAQCRIYVGPHTKYLGHEICWAYNENAIVVYDVTDKSDPKVLSKTSYEGASYVHQGWLLDEKWHQYIVSDDEYDEVDRVGLASDGRAVTYIWDFSDLTAPKQTGYYKSEDKTVDHNQYVINGLAFQSNYGAGLHVLNITSIPSDPSGKGVYEAGFFDVYPEDDAIGGSTKFVGTWSSYAYFKSGYIFINSIERGGWVVKMQNR